MKIKTIMAHARKHQFRHWTPRYLYDRFKLFIYEIKHPNHPWLTEHVNMIMSNWLRKTDLGFEWGSGRSTIYFAKRVKNFTSIEHNLIWYEKVKKNLADANLLNAKILLFEVNQNYEDIKNHPYVKIVDNFPNNSLDFILIDGLFRIECALKSLKKVKPSGLLIIDNINLCPPSTSYAPNSRTMQNGAISQRWEKLSELLKMWRCIWTTNGVWDTAIWIKPCASTHQIR